MRSYYHNFVVVVDFLITAVTASTGIRKIFVNLVLLPITKSDISFLSGGVGKHPHRQHLTSLWLDECLDSLELMEVAYYHRPLPASPLTALRGVVTCVSGRSCSQPGLLVTFLKLFVLQNTNLHFLISSQQTFFVYANSFFK